MKVASPSATPPITWAPYGPWLMGPLPHRVFEGKPTQQKPPRASKPGPKPGPALSSRSTITATGLGHICEIADAEYPYTPRGCIAQAWSVAEILRAAVEDVYAAATITKRRPTKAVATPVLAKAAKPLDRSYNPRLHRMQHQLLHSPVQQLCNIQLVLRRASQSHESTQTVSSAAPSCPARPPASRPALTYKSAQECV